MSKKITRVQGRWTIRLLVASLVYSCAVLASDFPKFDDYKVKEVSTAKVGGLDFKNNLKAKHFKTQLTEAVGQQANFAGHYFVATWGCGTSCQVVALIDVKSGKTYFAPFSTSLGSSFRVDSSLFVDSPIEAIREYYNGDLDVENRLFFSSYYVWDENKTEFRLLYEDEARNE